MAAFSINNILSSPHHRRLHLLTSSPSTTRIKTHSDFTLQLPRQRNNSNSNSGAVLVFATPQARAVAADTDMRSDSASTLTLPGWAEFSEKASGEWDGFGADFTAEGKPTELPESVVPEAYREWEVKVFDWQTQCPSLAQSIDGHPCFTYKTIKLLPTVGCEADAATRYAVEERNVTAAHAFPFAYQSTGCYVALWPAIAGGSMELEHCLIDPRDKESRVRIIQVLQIQESKLKLQSIKVFVEQWYGPFRNGDQLGGCAIRDSAFAATQPLQASQVSGTWQGNAAVASFRDSHHVMPTSEHRQMIQRLGDGCLHELIRDESDLVLLPKQLWCLMRHADDGESFCEVGWLLDRGLAITSRCILSGAAELMEMAVATETTIPTT